MQTQDLESATKAKPNEQLEVHERQPYQAPSLVQLDLAHTEAGGPGATDASILS
jgi:hypothetical protein